MSTLAMAFASVKRTHDGPIPERDVDDVGGSNFSLESPHQSKKCRMMAPPRHYLASPQETDRVRRKRVVHRRPLPPSMCDDDLDADGDDEDDHMDDDDDCAPKQSGRRQYNVHQARFVPSSAPEPVERFILSEVKRKKRQQVKDELLALQSTGSASASASAPSVKFSLQQVMSIVDKAVRARETELQEEFGQILATKLDEQYHQFTKYTQDFVHQRLQNSQFNYMS